MDIQSVSSNAIATSASPIPPQTPLVSSFSASPSAKDRNKALPITRSRDEDAIIRGAVFATMDFFASNPQQSTLHITVKPPKWLRSWPDIKEWFKQLGPFVGWHYHGGIWFARRDSDRYWFELLIAAGFDAHQGTDLETCLFSATPEQKRTAMNPRLLAEANRWEGLKAYSGMTDIQVAPIEVFPALFSSDLVFDLTEGTGTIFPGSKSWDWLGKSEDFPRVGKEEMHRAWNLEEDYLAAGDPALCPEIGLSPRYPRPYVPTHPAQSR